MDFTVVAKEITKWTGICVGVDAGIVVAGLALGYGASFVKKWYNKKFYTPYKPHPHIERVEHSRREPK